MMDPILFYHKSCVDGSACNWIYNKKYPKGDAYGVLAGVTDFKNHNLIDKNIIFADVCPGNETTLNEILNVASSVTIIDHHETSHEMLNNFKHDKLTVIYDNDKCGCILLWEYFFKEDMPWFLEYIDDRDRWIFKLENSKYISTGMYELGLFFSISGFEILLKKSPNEFIEIGKQIMNKNDRQIEYMMESALEKKFIDKQNKHWNVWFVSCNIYHLRSELGNKLCQKKLSSDELPDFVVMWRKDKYSDNIFMSCRSINVSVGDITKYFNCGGGHKNAAGFTLESYDEIKKYFY